MSTGLSKIASERNQRTLMELALMPGNDICADCRTRNPRWASYNLGIFLCVPCASIHRKMGTHISKVKSITLDQWTKEQVEVMKQNGNIKSNSHYNPNESRNPPPTNMVDSERDSELESHIRNKYEFKRFVDRSNSTTSQSAPPRSASVNLTFRPKTTPVPNVSFASGDFSPPPLPPKSAEVRSLTRGNLASVGMQPSIPSQMSTIQPTRSASQPLTLQENARQAPASTLKPIQSQLWNDLVSLQSPSQISSLPLQFQAPVVSNATAPFKPQQNPFPLRTASGTSNLNPYSNLSINPGMSFTQTPQTSSPVALSPSQLGPGMGFNSGLHTGITIPANVTGINNPFQQHLAFSPSAPNTNIANPFHSYIPSTGNPAVGSMGVVNTSLPLQQPSLQPFQHGMQPQLQSYPSMSAQPQTAGSTFFQPQNQLSPTHFSPQTPYSATPPCFVQQDGQPQHFGQNNPYGGWQQGQQGQQQGGPTWGTF